MNRCWTLGIILSMAATRICTALNPLSAYCLEVSPDGKMVAANLGGMYGLNVYDLATGKELAHLETATPEHAKVREDALPSIVVASWVQQIAFSPDNHFLCCTTLDEEAAIILWDTAKLSAPTFIKADHWAYCEGLTFSSDASKLFTFMKASPNGPDFFVAWNTTTGAESWRRSVDAPEVRDVHSLLALEGIMQKQTRGPAKETAEARKAGSADGGQNTPGVETQPASPFTATCVLNDIKVLNGATKKELHLKAIDNPKNAPLTSKNLVIAEVNEGLQVWNAETGKLLFNLGEVEAKPDVSLFGKTSEAK